MTQQPSGSEIAVYLGAPIEHAAEERFLRRFVRDLKARGCGATILANFHVRGRTAQRQIDHLVVTQARIAHIELKQLSQEAPITGGLNGPWRQEFGPGDVRDIQPNPYIQAHNGTYAISDVAGRLMDRGVLPLAKPFYKHIDTLVCIDPGIPPGSTILDHAHVTVIDYENLIDRLMTPGPRVLWDPEYWDEFVRELGVYLEEQDSPARRRRQASAEASADYRRRFTDRTTAALHERVPLALMHGEAIVTLDDVVERLLSDDDVAIVGRSGAGKTHFARHASVELTRRGALVIWVDCGEYEQSRLRTLLSRSTAPYSTDGPGRLAEHAGTAGECVVLVLDGINQCPPQLRESLMTELDAWRLRFRSALLVTSSTDVPPELAKVVLSPVPPSLDERVTILRSHGSRRPDSVSDVFNTPFELAVAAACEADLSVNATPADLYDAYVRHFAPNEVLRSGLRALAIALVDELRSSLRLSDATALLGGAAGAGMTSDVVDRVLSCPLLVVAQGRVGFSHELFGRFLAAEALTLSADSTDALLEALRPAHRRGLASLSLAVESNGARRVEMLTALADARHYVAAVKGEMGSLAAEHARAAIAGVLADATFAAGSDNVTLETPSTEVAFFPQWNSSSRWSANEIALLEAAGALLAEGHFVGEVADLLDRTDERCQAEINAFRDAGVKNPISAVLSSLFLFGGVAAAPLGVTTVLHACDMARSSRHGGVATRIFDGSTSRSWCRLYAACLLCHSDPAKERDGLLADLLNAAWSAGGYHLRLQALQMVHMCGKWIDEEAKDTVAEILEAFDTSNLALGSGIVEALAAVDRLAAPVPSAEQLANYIRLEVFSMDEGPEAWAAASGICSSQWEREDIVGPYYEAVHESLTEHERFNLFIRAARCEDGYSRSWALEQLCYLSPTGDPSRDDTLRQVFADVATGPPAHTFLAGEGHDAHVYAVRGLARLGAALPTCAKASPEGQAWRLVDELIVDVETGTEGSTPTWVRIHSECPLAVIDVLSELLFVGRVARVGREDAEILSRILDRNRSELRQLLEWGLRHGADDYTQDRPFPYTGRLGFIIDMLGHVGDTDTAEMLRPFLAHPGVARDAVAAIRRLNA